MSCRRLSITQHGTPKYIHTPGLTMKLHHWSFRKVLHSRKPCLVLLTCRIWIYWHGGQFGSCHLCMQRVWRSRNLFQYIALKSSDRNEDTETYSNRLPIQSCRIVSGDLCLCGLGKSNASYSGCSITVPIAPVCAEPSRSGGLAATKWAIYAMHNNLSTRLLSKSTSHIS